MCHYRDAKLWNKSLFLYLKSWSSQDTSLLRSIHIIKSRRTLMKYRLYVLLSSSGLRGLLPHIIWIWPYSRRVTTQFLSSAFETEEMDGADANKFSFTYVYRLRQCTGKQRPVIKWNYFFDRENNVAIVNKISSLRILVTAGWYKNIGNILQYWNRLRIFLSEENMECIVCLPKFLVNLFR